MLGQATSDYLTSGAVHDLTRGFKRRNFWLMETQPGHVNWSPVNNELNKGEVRLMAWHAVAHGADAVLYWQWRSAAGGQEQYHGALLDQSGQPRPLYQEIQQLGQDFKTASDLLAGSLIKAEVAMLNSYDSRWSIHWQRHHREFSYEAHFNNYYSPLAKRNLDVDVISADEPLDGYALVIAPTLLILNDKRVEHIKKFVKRGGTLVLTLRTGMKDSIQCPPADPSARPVGGISRHRSGRLLCLARPNSGEGPVVRRYIEALGGKTQNNGSRTNAPACTLRECQWLVGRSARRHRSSLWERDGLLYRRLPG